MYRSTRDGKVVMGKINGEELDRPVGCELIFEGWRPLRSQEGVADLRQEEAKSGSPEPVRGLMNEEIRTELKVRRQVGAHLLTASKEGWGCGLCGLTLWEALKLRGDPCVGMHFPTWKVSSSGAQLGGFDSVWEISIRNYNNSTSLSFSLNSSHNKLPPALQEKWYSSHFTGKGKLNLREV